MKILFTQLLDGSIIEKFVCDECEDKSEIDCSSIYKGLIPTENSRGYLVQKYENQLLNGTNYALCGIQYTPNDTDVIELDSSKLLGDSIIFLQKTLKNIYKKDFIIKSAFEQEFFLYDPNKEIGLDNDCYLAPLDNIVKKFFKEVSSRLSRFEIVISSFHSEVANNQFEITPKYDYCFKSYMDNVLIMKILDEVAQEFNLEVSFSEKVHENLNGSGKHLNWSIWSVDECRVLNNEMNNDFLEIIFNAVSYHGESLISTIYTGKNKDRLSGKYEAPNPTITIEKNQEIRNRNASVVSMPGRIEFRSIGAGQCGANFLSMLNYAIADGFINKDSYRGYHENFIHSKSTSRLWITPIEEFRPPIEWLLSDKEKEIWVKVLNTKI